MQKIHKHTQMMRTTTLAIFLSVFTYAQRTEKDEALIEEVVINEKREAITKTNLGAEVIDIQSISKIPVLLGEKDIIKTLQFLPGVVSTEGSSGFSVRGGAIDQNLTLLDDAPVFNNSHLGGLFSTFNSDALKSVTLYKGNMPPSFGGRLSSVIDIKSKDGDFNKYNFSGGIGLISSRLSIDGPIQKGKSSFIISARRTYVDLFFSDDSDVEDLFFYDINATANFQLNKNNGIHLSTYFGRDVLNLRDSKNYWGNIVASLDWNSIINSKLRSNTSLTFSRYNYKTSIPDSKGEPMEIIPNMDNFGLKQNFIHYLRENHILNYGLQSSYYTFNTPNLPARIQSGFLKDPRSMWESALYANDEFKVNDKFSINYGLRLSMISSKNKGETNSYFNLEPRLVFNYEFIKDNTFRLGYTRNTQPLQTLLTLDGSIPIDIFLNTKKPAIADQVNFGYTKKINKDYEFNAEVFYKKMSGLQDYKEGVVISVLGDLQSSLLYNGRGRAYGLEILAKKNNGDLTGWISYTLSKSQMQIEGINGGRWYNARLDKTHNLAIVANYQLSTNWSLSGAFSLSTGIAVTLPTGKYELDGETYLQFGDKNSNRMPLYHRLDLSATYERKSSKRFKGSWTFGIYNIYGQKNREWLYFDKNRDNHDQIEVSQDGLFFRLIPSVTYNFKF